MDAQHRFTNAEIAERLRMVATALKLRGEDRFGPPAYERAARGVETYPDDLVRMWEHGRLRGVPGVGGSISQHLDELFRQGRVRYWDELMGGIPESVFELLRVPGVGPVTAFKLARAGVEDLEDLERKLEGSDLEAAGFRAKQLAGFRAGLAELRRRPDRMLLHVAQGIAAHLVEALRGLPGVTRAEVAGSVRRQAATAGDINIVVAGDQGVLAGVARLPSVGSSTLVSETEAEVQLQGGQRVRLHVAPPERFGVLLLWATGSAAHTGKVAHLMADRGLRLSPEGLFEADGALLPCADEEQIYSVLGMAVPAPELREDWGEVEAALSGTLPDLLEARHLRGDLHTHTSWSDGRDTTLAMLQAVKERGHEYVAITDHSYPNLDFRDRAEEIVALRKQVRGLRIINGLEVNITIDGGLQVPDEILLAHDFCLASIHTGFRQPAEQMTARLLAALAHPAINGIAHPTGRLLLRREGIEADWDAVFDACLRYDKFLEIDGPPDRLDLRDDLVQEAVRRGVKLMVDSDAHATGELAQQAGGVTVARRGWAGSANVLNTLPWEQFVREAHVRGV